MSIRPHSACWFEILLPVAYSAHVTSNLARTGAVELEVRPHQTDLMHLPRLSDDITQYRELNNRYGRYWARGSLRFASFILPPQEVLKNALARISIWSREADPIIADLQALDEERARLHLLHSVFSNIHNNKVDLNILINAGPVLTSRIIVWPDSGPAPIDTALLTLETYVDELNAEFVVLAVDSLVPLQNQLSDINGRLVSLPGWLNGNFYDASQQLSNRLKQLEYLMLQRYAQLDDLYDDNNLSDVLGDVASLEWCIHYVGSLEPASELFVWITGWTSSSKEKIRQSFIDEDIPSLIHFPPPPKGANVPQILHNPWWSKPFEVFTRALGIPSSTEVDPSSSLVLIVPLLFGYMFGDVGQGVLLIAAGFYLIKRWQLAPLLIACGISAVLFGFLFGSVFSREDLLPALWLHPLDEPLTILFVPLIFAIFLLALGQLLNAVEYFWRGNISVWLRVDAGFLIFYLGLAWSLLTVQVQELMLLGVFWFLLGKFSTRPTLLGFFIAVGSLLEDALRLLVNTVSFSRVGAFCLAHAGLSSALLTLVNATDSVFISVLIMIIANLLIVLLEGLVVSIQTTRLVLFEFFNWFLQGQGRVFKPLPLPPLIIKRRAS